MIDRQQRAREIIDNAINDLIAIGATRSAALKLLAFQAVLCLRVDGDDAALLELRGTLIDEIDLSLTPASDESTH